MKKFKVFVIICAVLAFSVPGWTGNVPEYDSSGNDYFPLLSENSVADIVHFYNIFAIGNLIQYGQVAFRNVDSDGFPINFVSDFTYDNLGKYVNADLMLNEEFINPGPFDTDLCFGRFDDRTDLEQFFPSQVYWSVLTPAWASKVYDYKIVLQMTPESDIDLNIYDCVLKPNGRSPWFSYELPVATGEADQTGRWRAPWAEMVFDDFRNPRVTVKAWPGRFPSPGFEGAFTMDARTLPELASLSVDQVLYTSKGIWDENIVLALPTQGGENAAGETTYALSAGDIIQVILSVDRLPVDVYYGDDNVILKYVGIVGSWVTEQDI